MFLKGYCRNEHIVGQARGFKLLAAWLTKKDKLPGFVHAGSYDNAPSHHKRGADALHVDGSPRATGTRAPRGGTPRGTWRSIA